MKKIIAIVLAITMLATLSGVALAGTGNGAPSGSHFNLNIIGMKYEKGSMGVKEGGHVIFVELYSSKQGKVRVATDILLSKAPAGESFMVLDGNGTDGEATFQLPAMPFSPANTPRCGGFRFPYLGCSCTLQLRSSDSGSGVLKADGRARLP